MRIEVDLDLCQGHAMCEMEAPEIFEAERESVNLLDPQPDDSHMEDVKRAVRYCPTQALKIIEE